jgi:urease accessory protein UreF
LQEIYPFRGIFTAGIQTGSGAALNSNKKQPRCKKMLRQSQLVPETAELLGDLGPLIEQIGAPRGLNTLAGAAGALQIRRIHSAADLRAFVGNYHAEILQPLELPAIQRAFHHASRNELRELLAYDRQLAGEPLLQSFVSASRLIGQVQLERLRPLRDHRFAQRYLAAVGRGEADGWHTLIFGLTLAIYSVPLRQGLFVYAQQTTRGFIQAAARSLALSEAHSQTLLDEFSTALPAAIESLATPPGITGAV